MTARNWIIALGTAAVIATAGLGLASAHSEYKSGGGHGSMMDPAARSEQRLNHLSERLDLDDAQREAIAGIMAEHDDRMRTMRSAIDAVLTDSQRERMASMGRQGSGMSDGARGHRPEGGCSHDREYGEHGEHGEGYRMHQRG